MGWQADLADAAAAPRRLTHSAQIASDRLAQGKPVLYIPDAPDGLLAVARGVDPSITSDEYAAARMLASEGYSGPVADRPYVYVALAECARNAAASKEITVARLMQRSIYGTPLDGRYGQQSGRWASTAQDPTTYHLAAVRVAWSDHGPDLTRGCIDELDPSGMGKPQAGRITQSAESVLRKWHGPEDRLAFTPVPGIDAFHTMFFRREPDAAARALALDAALAVCAAGGGRLTGASLALGAVGVLCLVAGITPLGFVLVGASLMRG
jgi:hypothetical protein